MDSDCLMAMGFFWRRRGERDENILELVMIVQPCKYTRTADLYALKDEFYGI